MLIKCLITKNKIFKDCIKFKLIILYGYSWFKYINKKTMSRMYDY